MSTTFKQKQRTIFIGFALGAVVLLPSIVALILSNSLTMLTAILISASGTAANFLSWLTLCKVSRGKTFEYNYGYGKWENLVSLVVASIMFASVGLVIYNVVSRVFLAPVLVNATGIIMGMFITGPSAIINAWLWRKSYALAKKEHSPIMESQWRLFRSKVVTNVCALLSYTLSMVFRNYSWSFVFDPIFSLFLLGFLIYSAYSVFTNSIYDLLDRALEESLQIVILRELATYYDEYTQLHGITSRRSGGNVYIELLLEFNGNQSMTVVQKVINRIRSSLEDKIQNSRVIVAPVTAPIK